jgi:hypothetical protein
MIEAGALSPPLGAEMTAVGSLPGDTLAARCLEALT